MHISGLVSVIIPVRDGALTIDRCLEAIARQTYRPLELVVIDDGSNDPSAAWVRAFRKRHPELSVHVVEQSPLGTAAAINVGLTRVRGEFVAFAHQADEWHAEKLAWQVAQLQGHSAAEASIAAVAEQIGTARTQQSPPRGWPMRPVALSSLLMRRSALAPLNPALATVSGFTLAARCGLSGSALRLGREVAVCHRKRAALWSADEMARVWQDLRDEGRLGDRRLAATTSRVYAERGWQCLLAAAPDAAREDFRRAARLAWRPEAWIGLACVGFDRALIATGWLRQGAQPAFVSER
ncbi:MAG TPA: glycosyltransferase family A protein [Oscillatoriaceae cyanobacterium]